MTEIEYYEVVCKLIANLWPNYQNNEDRMAITWRALKNYLMHDVVDVLREHWLEEPDARDPKWKAINAAVRERCKHVHQESLNEFEAILNQARLHFKHMGWPKGWEQWDDEQVYNYLFASEHYGDTHDTMTQKRRVLSERASWRLQEARRMHDADWRRYLKRINQPVPRYLNNEPPECETIGRNAAITKMHAMAL